MSSVQEDLIEFDEYLDKRLNNDTQRVSLFGQVSLMFKNIYNFAFLLLTVLLVVLFLRVTKYLCYTARECLELRKTVNKPQRVLV